MSEARQRYILGAGTEVISPDGRLLLIEQERGGRVEWSGPGGAMEGNESIADAARRETLEETGLQVRLERLLRIGEFWDHGHFVGVFFLFLATPDPWPQEVRLPELDGVTRFHSYRWCTRDEVATLEPRWVHHVSRTAWPADIVTPILDRWDVPAGRIRPARPDETPALVELARRSKAHWGYDAEFMAAARALLSVTPEDVKRDEVHLLEAGELLIGWYRVSLQADRAELEDLWVEPAFIGQGHGRRLWEHAVETARAAGASVMELDADPNAERFYLTMGAERAGERPSELSAERLLPRMRLRL